MNSVNENSDKAEAMIEVNVRIAVEALFRMGKVDPDNEYLQDVFVQLSKFVWEKKIAWWK